MTTITVTQVYTMVIHPAEEGGYWAELLELPGCVTQGETIEEVKRNMKEAMEAVGQPVDDPVRIKLAEPSDSFNWPLAMTTWTGTAGSE